MIILGTGILGTAFGKIFPKATVFSSKQLNICHHTRVREILSSQECKVLINCAAFTNVDLAETESKKAFAVNSEAVENLATICKEQNISLMHFSTDYVFDGKASLPYKENDATNPVNVYGQSKLAGEENLKKHLNNFWLIRTSSLFGKGGKNFVDNMVNMRDKKEVGIVSDQVFSPTFSKDLALKCQKIINKKFAFGTYHISNQGSCSWADFAREIFAYLGSPCQVKEISSLDLGRPANRPSFSVLKNTKTDLLRSWKSALCEYLEAQLS